MATTKSKQQIDAVVATDGSGDYTTINAAVAAAPSSSHNKRGTYVVHIRAGVYKEIVRVATDKTNLTLVGDGMDKTVISGSRCYADYHDTQETATVAVHAVGFVAKDLGIENTAGPKPEGGQAVAFLSESDRSVLYRCALTGFQDTLYALKNRQFYRDCRISGTVDFIFGNASAVFQNCDILARLPYAKQKNTVTAQGRQSADENTGFVFQRCTVARAPDLVSSSAQAAAVVRTYLGRPWKSFSRTVFMQSNISDVVDPEGWLPWEAGGGPVPDTLYYAEYDNTGPGADVTRRVRWPGFHVIRDPAQATAFTVDTFIDGNRWLPDTGVDYTPGLQ